MGATLHGLLDALDRRATWRTSALGVAGMVGLTSVMSAAIFPAILERRPQAMQDDYLVMLDLEPLRSSAEVYQILDLYSADILPQVRLVYLLDFPTPAMFSLILLGLCGAMLRYTGLQRGPWRLALLAPFAGLPFDYTENILALVLLSQHQAGHDLPGLARAAGVVTALKFLGVAAAGLTTLALLLRTVLAFATRRGTAGARD